MKSPKGFPVPGRKCARKKNRFYLGSFTGVFDQLFDRDDENEPSHVSLTDYDPIIIVSPVWIHMLASPMRTYLKQHTVKNKSIFVVASNQGHYTHEKDEQSIREFLTGLGARVRDIRGIMTKEKAWENLRLEAESMSDLIVPLKN